MCAIGTALDRIIAATTGLAKLGPAADGLFALARGASVSNHASAAPGSTSTQRPGERIFFSEKHVPRHDPCLMVRGDVHANQEGADDAARRRCCFTRRRHCSTCAMGARRAHPRGRIRHARVAAGSCSLSQLLHAFSDFKWKRTLEPFESRAQVQPR
jgi:hypothetical protein